MTAPGRPTHADPLPDAQRRRLLAGSATAIAGAGLAFAGGTVQAQTGPAAAAPAALPAGPRPLPAYVAWKDPAAMIVHSANTIETRRTAFGSGAITPSEQLYIRNNLPPPAADVVADRDAWMLTLEGVGTPRTVSVRELKAMGLETLTMVLQCSGNGRSYFPSKPSGTPWQVGAAGCVTWAGVPVRTVVELLGGVGAGLAYMTGTGGETLPPGIDPATVMVERSVPLAAMQDAMLAWELNGVPVPLAHGGPLRLIVPGYTGVNSVKYLRRLAFTAQQSPAAIQQTGYRLTPPGGKASPSDPSVWEMGPKSWINAPAPERGPLQPGRVVVQGVAFGGMHAAERVEVSVDGGASWRAARFIGPDLGRYAWRPFALMVELPAGRHTLASRVTDSRGTVQAEQRMENLGGYINSSWRDHALQVTVG